MISLNIFTFLILLAVINGILLSILLFASKKKNRQANILLALTIIFYTLPVLRIITNDTSFFKEYADFSFLFVELIFGLGPSLYLYSKSITNPQFKMRIREYLHYLPVFIEFVYYTTQSYTSIEKYTLTTPANIHHLIWMLEQAGAVISLLTYLSLTIRHLFRYKKWVHNNYSDTHKKTLKWLEKPLLLYSFFWLAWLGLRAVDVISFGETLNLNYYYPLLTFLSFITCWIGFMGYTKPEIVTQDFVFKSPVPPAPAGKIKEYATLVARLKEAMESDKLYLNPELNLTNLSQHLNLNPRVASKLINEGTGKSFYDFVNEYRIEEVKRKLVNPDNGHITILGLALESGFNSKATFNHIFKKFTGTTPKNYMADFMDKTKNIA